MSNTGNLYRQQKGIANKYTTYILVDDVEEKEVNGKKMIFVRGLDGKDYSHFVDAKNEGWEKELIKGKEVGVYVVEKEINGKLYRNIYKKLW